jgi:hypothetical protein
VEENLAAPVLLFDGIELVFNELVLNELVLNELVLIEAEVQLEQLKQASPPQAGVLLLMLMHVEAIPYATPPSSLTLHLDQELIEVLKGTHQLVDTSHITQ